jgi:hypothetical protein
MAKKRTSFYRTRQNSVCISIETAAEILGCSVDQVKDYDENGAPVMAERLLMLWDKKHIQIEGWQGWLFSRGILRYKNRRYTAKTLLAMSESTENEFFAQCELRRLYSAKGIVKIIRFILLNKCQ